jgi:hypothetical protein
MGKNDTELTAEDIIEYNLQVLPKFKDIEPTYSIVSRVRKRTIKGGDSVEIDIYVTGLGIPEANKLVLLWSSPNVIDISIPGVAIYCIREVNKKWKGENVIAPVAGARYVNQSELDPNGIALHLNRGYFLPVPKLPAPKYEHPNMPLNVGERIHEGYHPISISLPTQKKAKAGDYKIDLTLTYSYKKTIKQTSDKVEFRITSWWDRHQGWIITAGSIIAFILLMLTVVNIWFPIGG